VFLKAPARQFHGFGVEQAFMALAAYRRFVQAVRGDAINGVAMRTDYMG
jgi:hypothetical protein